MNNNNALHPSVTEHTHFQLADWAGRWITDDGDVHATRAKAIAHLQLVGEPGTLGKLRQLAATDQDADAEVWEVVQL